MLHVGSVWCVKTYETKDGDEGMQQAVFSLLTFLPHLHRPSDYPLMQGWFPQPTKIKRNIIIKINKTWEIYSRKNLYKNLSYKGQFDCFHCFSIVLPITSSAASWNWNFLVAPTFLWLQFLNQSTLTVSMYPKNKLGQGETSASGILWWINAQNMQFRRYNFSVIYLMHPTQLGFFPICLPKYIVSGPPNLW